MIYYVDIDQTICNTTKSEYSNATPYLSRIEKINKLFDDGHEIHYWTARGSKSGINWKDLTLRQLRTWGVKYTTLNMNKPVYDFWIDDKAINSEDFFK